MINREGSHGTSVTKAGKIFSIGFDEGDGLRGTGVYFWKKSKYYLQLAESWYKQSKEKGRYSGDFDSNLQIIICDFEVPNESFIDFNDDEFAEKIDDLVEKKGLRHSMNKKQFCALYDYFVTEYEKEANCKVMLTEAKVSAPDVMYRPYYNVNVLGLPKCLILRDINGIKSKRASKKEEIYGK